MSTKTRLSYQETDTTNKRGFAEKLRKTYTVPQLVCKKIRKV
jgi:hypothetical protein